MGNLFSFSSYDFFGPLLAIVLLAAAVIVGLDCVWRVEKRLDTFMKLLIVGISVLLVANIIQLLGGEMSILVENLMHYLQALAALMLLLSVGEMYKIIRSLDNENPPSQQKP
jgi:putative Mn2+ efflux pump MntP